MGKRQYNLFPRSVSYSGKWSGPRRGLIQSWTVRSAGTTRDLWRHRKEALSWGQNCGVRIQLDCRTPVVGIGSRNRRAPPSDTPLGSSVSRPLKAPGCCARPGPGMRAKVWHTPFTSVVSNCVAASGKVRTRQHCSVIAFLDRSVRAHCSAKAP